MRFNKILKNALLVILACFALTACATKKVSTGQMQGDVYTGTDTVEYLAKYSTVSVPVYTSPCIWPVETFLVAQAVSAKHAKITSNAFFKILLNLILLLDQVTNS